MPLAAPFMRLFGCPNPGSTPSYDACILYSYNNSHNHTHIHILSQSMQVPTNDRDTNSSYDHAMHRRIPATRFFSPNIISISSPHVSRTLPETTPANVMLTQVLQVRGLPNQPRHLPNDLQLLSWASISTRKLLLYPRKHLQCASILHLLGLDVIGRRRNTRAVARSKRRDGVCGCGVHVAHDGLAAFGGEVGFGWGGSVVETPC